MSNKKILGLFVIWFLVLLFKLPLWETIAFFIGEVLNYEISVYDATRFCSIFLFPFVLSLFFFYLFLKYRKVYGNIAQYMLFFLLSMAVCSSFSSSFWMIPAMGDFFNESPLYFITGFTFFEVYVGLSLMLLLICLLIFSFGKKKIDTGSLKIGGLIIAFLGIFLFLIAYFWSKNEHKPISEKFLKKSVKTEQFNQDIIKNIKQYDVLQKFLAINADTLLGYTGANDFSLVFILTMSSSEMVDKVPPFLRKEVIDISRQINFPLIATIDKNKQITMNIETKLFKMDSTEAMSTDISIQHQLIWNKSKLNVYNNDISKDTLLKNNILYQIIIHTHEND